MDRTAAFSYIYAKASGILAKSFVGDRANLLFSVKKLPELWTLLFDSPVPSVPEKLLAQEIEKKAFDNFITTYLGFVNLFDKPDAILLKQLQIFEGENLKEIAAALCSNEQVCPELIDLKTENHLRTQFWPDIKKITEQSEYSWYNTIPSIHEQQKYEFKIDLQIVRAVWDSINKLTFENSDVVRRMYKDEFVLKNIVWALRLKVYFNMTNEEIKKNLIYVTDTPGLQDPVAKEAIKILDKETDNYEVWKNWKYNQLVNPHIDGQIWSIDPTWVEKMGRLNNINSAKLLFHQYPMTTAALLSWFKIKNYELNCIRTAVESIKLNMNSNDVMNIIGIN